MASTGATFSTLAVELSDGIGRLTLNQPDQLNHLRDSGTDIATPRLRPSDADMPARPWIDDFSAGYIQRMLPFLPKQGDRKPWVNTQRYSEDKVLIREAPIDDGVMTFTSSAVTEAARPAPSHA